MGPKRYPAVLLAKHYYLLSIYLLSFIIYNIFLVHLSCHCALCTVHGVEVYVLLLTMIEVHFPLIVYKSMILLLTFVVIVIIFLADEYL